MVLGVSILAAPFPPQSVFSSLKGSLAPHRRNEATYMGLVERRRPAGAAGVIGVPVDLQAGIRRRFQEQGEVLTPIAGDDAVGARRLDLGDVGREIRDLQQRMQPTISMSGRFSFSIF